MHILIFGHLDFLCLSETWLNALSNNGVILSSYKTTKNNCQTTTKFSFLTTLKLIGLIKSNKKILVNDEI